MTEGEARVSENTKTGLTSVMLTLQPFNVPSCVANYNFSKGRQFVSEYGFG